MKKIKLALVSSPLAGILLFGSSALLAGNAGTSAYWTRGYDGTVVNKPATTIKSIFDENGDLSERIIATENVNTAVLGGTGVVDTTTGALTSTAPTSPTYVADGSLYLHIGYINSGYTGAGTTVDAIDLNGDLVLGRFAYENNAGANPDTPNLPTLITAGDSTNKITFDYQDNGNILFFRSNTGTTSNLQIDASVVLANLGRGIRANVTAGGLFGPKRNITLTFGSAEYLNSTDYKRVLHVEANDGVAENIAGSLFNSAAGSTVNIYSDVIWEGSVYKFVENGGDYHFYSTVTIDHAISTGATMFAKLTNAGSLQFDKGITVNSAGAMSSGETPVAYAFTLMSLEAPSNSAIVNGSTSVKNVLGAFTLANLAGADSTASINGDLTVSDIGGTTILANLTGARSNVSIGKKINDDERTTITVNSGIGGVFTLVNLDGVGSTATIDGNIDVNKINNTFTLFNLTKANQSVVVNGDITFYAGAGSTNGTRLFTGASAASGSSITFNGNIKFNDNGGANQLLGASWAGSIVNFNGTISSNRTNEVSFGGHATAVVNFRGSESNTLNNAGLRASVYNLMKTDGSASIDLSAGGTNNNMCFGGNARVNLFGENQIVGKDTTIWRTWTPLNKIGVTINMNGKNLAMGTYQPGGSDRIAIIDFGATELGMTADQMAASGITPDMVFETGAGIAQTFSIAGVDDGYSAATVADCYILFKNYLVGEDKIISKVQLSLTDLNGSVCFSETDITKNILRIDGYTDADKYGVDYKLEEIDLGNGTWEYTLTMIPEPSAYAAIFGAIALALAALNRRRK